MNAMRRPAVAVLLAAVAALSACGGPGGGGGPGAGKPSLDPADQEADDAAKDLLELANRAANRFYETDGTYEGFDAAAAAEEEPEITWLDGTEPEVEQVSIVEATASHLHLITLSAGGLYFCLRGVSQFGRGVFDISRGASFDEVDEPGECVESGS